VPIAGSPLYGLPASKSDDVTGFLDGTALERGRSVIVDNADVMPLSRLDSSLVEEWNRRPRPSDGEHSAAGGGNEERRINGSTFSWSVRKPLASRLPCGVAGGPGDVGNLEPEGKVLAELTTGLLAR
jgi:hypothetical protein